jgi:hypothetical protein
MSHNAPLSDAPRLTQKFGREATTILTQGEGDESCLHVGEIPLYNRTGFRDIFGIGTVIHTKYGAGFADIQKSFNRIIKAVMGFRGFMLRGKESVSGEWDLACMAYNIKRMHSLKMV